MWPFCMALTFIVIHPSSGKLWEPWKKQQTKKMKCIFYDLRKEEIKYGKDWLIDYCLTSSNVEKKIAHLFVHDI